MRLSLQQTPEQITNIGTSRGKTIGSLRPITIGQLRSATISGIFRNGLMLVSNDQTGLLVGKKQKNLGDNLPPQAAYDSAPIYREHTFEFRPTGGYGESVQSSRTDRRYHYAINCWVTGGLFGLGPASHTIVPASTGSIRLFVEALDTSRGLSLFILAGAYVLERTDDTPAGQIVSRTRAGHVATDAVRFTGAYSGAVDALYVAWDDGVLEEFNGAAWTPCVLPAGFLPNFLCRVGDELWAADGNACMIRKVTNDPKVAGSWSGPILIGTPSIKITALRQTTNRLVIFKADGDVFTINGDGSDNDMYPGLQNTIDPTNGRTAVAWQGSLWFRTGRAFWKLDVQGGLVLSPEGPGRQLQNRSEVRGPVQAFAGWNSQMAFGVIYNASLGNSYLLSYGNWEPVQGDTGTNFSFANQWDGALVRYTGRQAISLFVSSLLADTRLYVGFSDGSYDWIKLVPYPLIADGGSEYTSDTSYIVMPLHTDMFQADQKQTIGFSIWGPSIPVGSEVTISYRQRGAQAGLATSDPAGDYVTLGNPFTFNGQRQDSPTPIAGTALEVMVGLEGTPSASPILEGVGIHERLVPAFRRDFTFTVDARDAISRRDGASVRKSGRFYRDLVLQAAAAPATIALEFPDEVVMDVALFDYSERMVAHTQRGGQGWAIDCQATEFGLLETYGTIGRTRGTKIGDTRGFHISDMRHF
jgi:hypothetical protein